MGIAVKDDAGKYYLMTGNQIGCVLLYYILKSRKALGNLPADGAVVKSVVSTELARKIAESFGLVCFNTLTGFKWIAEKIQQFQDKGDHTFVFGFEESYGFLSSTFVRDKDGVNASLLIAEAAAWAKTQGKTLYDILQEIYKTYGYYVEKVVSVTLPGKDGVVKMKEIMKNLREKQYITMAENGYITLTDTGLKRAENVLERHTILSNWLIRIGVSEETAKADACKVEHDLSDESFEAIKKWTRSH